MAAARASSSHRRYRASDEVAPDLLALVSVVVGIGEGAQGAIEEFCDATGRSGPRARERPSQGHVLVGFDAAENRWRSPLVFPFIFISS
jgi:hypothetical protein